MAMMPLVPETKMADVRKLISLGNLLVTKVTWLVLKTTSATLILSHTFGAERITKITYIYSCLPRTHSFHCDFQRQHFHSLHCVFQRQPTLFHKFTSRDETHSLTVFTHRENTLSLIPSISTHSVNTHTHTHTLSLPLSLSLSLSYILTSSSQLHENIYILQPISFLFYLFG